MKRRTFSKTLLSSVGLLLLVSCNPSPSGKKANQQQDSIRLKVAAFNVRVSRNATAKEIGEALRPYDLDIVCFSEAPGGDWTKEAAEILGMDLSQRNTARIFKPEEERQGHVIDHIMYNPQRMEALDGGIIELETPLSDHKPVWALLELKY